MGDLKNTSEIGFCPMTISLEKLKSFKKLISDTKIKFKKTDNLVDKVWLERPSLNNGFIYEHNEKFSGLCHKEKKQKIIMRLTYQNLLKKMPSKH